MTTGFFASEIRRLNRNLFRLGLLLCALAVGWTLTLERVRGDTWWEPLRRLCSTGGNGHGRPAVVPLLLAGAGLFCMGRATLRMLRPATHPLLRRLGPGPLALQLRPVELALERGLVLRAPIRFGIPFLGNWSTTGRYRHHSMIRIGSGWFYYGCTLQAELRRLDDLVWFFTSEREMHSHGVALGTAHLLQMRFRDGSELLVSLGETPRQVLADAVRLLPFKDCAREYREVERTDVLFVLQEMAPWALIGRDAAMERAWASRRSRQDLIALVERRKAAGAVPQ